VKEKAQVEITKELALVTEAQGELLTWVEAIEDAYKTGRMNRDQLLEVYKDITEYQRFLTERTERIYK
jgi:hypothetical protein